MRDAVMATRAIGEALGFDVTVYAQDATKTADGRKVMQNGYFQGNNVLGINILGNAMQDAGKFATLKTVGHEITHFLEANAGEAYNQLKARVIAEMQANGQDFDAHVRSVINSRSSSLTYGEAVSEVIADSMELMLQQSNAMQQLAAENPGLAQKIFGRMKTFMRKVRSAMRGVLGGRHSQAVTQIANGMMQYSQELVDAFDKAMLAARANLQGKANGTAVDATSQASESMLEPGEVAESMQPTAEETITGERAAVMEMPAKAVQNSETTWDENVIRVDAGTFWPRADGRNHPQVQSRRPEGSGAGGLHQQAP